MAPLLIKDATLFPGTSDGASHRGMWLLSDGQRTRWERISPEPIAVPEAAEVVDACGRLVTPALVDCHTHLVYGGDRSAEFEQRLCGATYEEILLAGGGIHSTVLATAAASFDELVEAALPRVAALQRQGADVVEIKSGYGLTPAAEIRHLEAIAELAHRLESARPRIDVVRTLLLHTIPVARRGERERFVEEICRLLVPEVQRMRLADHIDVFCDAGAFTLEEAERILRAGRSAGFAIHCHAEQITHTGAAAMAAGLGGRSCEHLEQADAADIAAMADAGTVAVLLPGAQLVLRAPSPPVAGFRKAGVAMAVATDCNPGSSTTTNLLLMMQLACHRMGLQPAEAMLGTTTNAARALFGDAAEDRVIREGAPFRPVLMWPVSRVAELIYHLGAAFEPERLG